MQRKVRGARTGREARRASGVAAAIEKKKEENAKKGALRSAKHASRSRLTRSGMAVS